jgi:cytochrome c oxidase subunit 4
MRFFAVWLLLLALLAATAASSYVPLGEWNTVANLAVSCAKALLVAVFFMDLRRATGLLRLIALGTLLWLAILFGLSGSDFLTRHVTPAPWGLRP